MQKIEQYFNDPAVSQSDLKNIWYSLAKFKQEREKDYKEREGFLFGSAVDTYTTLGAAEFEKNYGYIDDKKPGEKPLQICNKLFDTLDQYPDRIVNTNDPAYIWQNLDLRPLMDEVEYRGNLSYDKRMTKLTDESYYYFEALMKQRGKIILDPEQFETVIQVSQFLLNSGITHTYFQPSNLFQQDIRFSHRGVNCKALLDIVQVDEENKTVRGVDVKTMKGNVLWFHSAVKKFRYDIQGAWYSLALHKAYPGYKILPFRFLVESTTSPGTPVVYQMTKLDYKSGSDGIAIDPVSSWRTDIGTHPVRRLPGYEDCLDKYLNHQLSGQFETELEIDDLYNTDKEYLKLNAWIR